jgi:hypothetical protein
MGSHEFPARLYETNFKTRSKIGMPCEEVKTAKYQTRKSPPFHAKNCKDLTKKGKDGDYVSKPDARGVYKWIKAGGATRKASKGGKSYLIHDNGMYPFKVQISGKDVEIYKGEYRKLADGKTIDYDNMDYNKLLKKLVVNEVHLGESPCIKAADDCGAPLLGNTILLHLSGNKYMYVGESIYEFTMEDEFEAYYSMMGRNDVPYPVLLGSKYVYMMLDHVFIPRELFKAKMNAAEWANAYAYFYGHVDLETGDDTSCFEKFRTKLQERKKCEKQKGEKHRRLMKGADKKMKGFKMIWKRGA